MEVLLFGSFYFLAMKIAINSCITEVAAEAENCTDSLSYATVMSRGLKFTVCKL